MKTQVHRFHNRAALCVYGDGVKGATMYLEPKEARKIARALNRVAKEIEDGGSFAGSRVGTVIAEGERA